MKKLAVAVLVRTFSTKNEKTGLHSALDPPSPAPVAQLAARGSHNPKVASSILAGSRILFCVSVVLDSVFW